MNRVTLICLPSARFYDTKWKVGEMDLSLRTASTYLLTSELVKHGTRARNSRVVLGPYRVRS
jgi:hypothetical protein